MNEREPMKIITIYIPDDHLAMLDELVDLNIYANRSDAMRIAFERFLKREERHQEQVDREKFRELMKNHPRRVKIKKKKSRPRRHVIPVKKKEPRYEVREFEQVTRPETFYKIFPRDLYFNHIVSHLADCQDFLDYDDLRKVLGVKRSYVSTLIYNVNKKVPNLIIRDSQKGKCKLNRDLFEELLKKRGLKE